MKASQSGRHRYTDGFEPEKVPDFAKTANSGSDCTPP